MMNKIAVLISGQPRTVARTWRSMSDHLLAQLGDHDVFIHTSQPYEESWAGWGPKSCCVEEQFRFPSLEDRLGDVFFHPPHLNSYLQQIYGWKRVWETKVEYEEATGSRYDFAVRCRPDLLFHGD